MTESKGKVTRVRKGPQREIVLRQRVPGTSMDRIVLACGHEFTDIHRNNPRNTKALCANCARGHKPGELPLEAPKQANGGHSDLRGIIALGLVEFVIEVDGRRVRCCVESAT